MRKSYDIRNAHCNVSRGFTLIELLVVIAIIALLVSILLPSLQRAKSLAKTASCLSNMRNIGTGLAMYVTEFNGIIPPGQEKTPDNRFEGVNAWWLLAEMGMVADGRVDDAAAAADVQSLYRCPDGLPEPWPGGNPVSKEDPTGAKYWSNWYKAEGQFTPTWYGLTGTTGTWWGDDWSPYPFRVLSVKLPSVADIDAPQSLAMIYDGLYLRIHNENYINARHNQASVTNILMADGHVESYKSSTLPTLGTINNDNLDGFEDPHWRLDQE